MCVCVCVVCVCVRTQAHAYAHMDMLVCNIQVCCHVKGKTFQLEERVNENIIKSLEAGIGGI